MIFCMNYLLLIQVRGHLFNYLFTECKSADILCVYVCVRAFFNNKPLLNFGIGLIIYIGDECVREGGRCALK